MLEFFQILETNTCEQYETLINIVKGVLSLIQFAIPIILIVMGTIDLGKAVMSSDEKEIKGAVTKLSKRALAAIAVFLVSSIVMLVMNMVSGAATKEEEKPSGFLGCWTYKGGTTENTNTNNDTDANDTNG